MGLPPGAIFTIQGWVVGNSVSKLLTEFDELTDVKVIMIEDLVLDCTVKF